jgi:heptosyltransferase III
MRILLVGWNRFGDAVISTALLGWLTARWPNARITVICGALAAEVLRPWQGKSESGGGGIEQIVVIGKHRMKVPVWSMLRQFGGTRWDLVIDLKDTLVSRIVRSQQILIWRRSSAACVSGQPTLDRLASLVGTEALPRPALRFDPATEAGADQALASVAAGRPILALGIGASNRRRCWPADHHAELARRFLSERGPDALVMVLGSPEEGDIADRLLQGIPDRQRLDLTRTLPFLLVQCACLKSALAFVGNDSGFMHAAGALGLPTVGLFGCSRPEVFAGLYPAWYPVTLPENGPMADISVDSVWHQVRQALVERTSARIDVRSQACREGPA